MRLSRISLAAFSFLFILMACKSESAEQKTIDDNAKPMLKGFWSLYSTGADEAQIVYKFEEDGKWTWYNEQGDRNHPTTYRMSPSQLNLSFKEGKTADLNYNIDMSSDTLLVLEALNGPKTGATFVLKHIGDKALSIAKISGTVGKDPLSNQSFKLSDQATILVRVKSDLGLISTELVNKQGAVIRSNIHSVWVGDLMASEFQLKIIGSVFPKKDDATMVMPKDIKFEILIDQIK